MSRLAWIVTTASLAVGCGDDAHGAGPDAPPAQADASVSVPKYAARIRGTLANPIPNAKAMHDGLAMGGEAQSHAAGDTAHQVGLGTTDLGTTQDEFLALDEWKDPAAAQGFYAFPQFKAAFDAQFTAPPNIEIFERHADWVSWGDIGTGRTSGQPFWFVVIEGRLKSPDFATNHAAHDTIAGPTEEQAKQHGDLAHLVHTRVGDDRTLFIIDEWNNEAGMLGTFTDQSFRTAFLSLFESPPDLRIYRSTDWYQWYAP